MRRENVGEDEAAHGDDENETAHAARDDEMMRTKEQTPGTYPSPRLSDDENARAATPRHDMSTGKQWKRNHPRPGKRDTHAPGRHADTSRTPSPHNGTMRRRGIHKQRKARNTPRTADAKPYPVRRHKTNATLHETTGVSTSRRKKTRTAPPCPMTMRRLMRQMTMRTTLRRDGMTSKQRLAAANRTATRKTAQDEQTRRPHETRRRDANAKRP